MLNKQSGLDKTSDCSIRNLLKEPGNGDFGVSFNLKTNLLLSYWLVDWGHPFLLRGGTSDYLWYVSRCLWLGIIAAMRQNTG